MCSPAHSTPRRTGRWGAPSLFRPPAAEQNRAEPFFCCCCVPGPRPPSSVLTDQIDGLPGFQIPSPFVLSLSLITTDLPLSLPPDCPSLFLPPPQPVRERIPPTSNYEHQAVLLFGIAIPSAWPPLVCLPACLPACFCLSCICVGRSSQLNQLNESSRFTRFGVLRRSRKARGTGSQSLQASMRPPSPAQPWNILPLKPCLRTTADGRSAPVPLPSLKNSKACYSVPVSWQQTQSARLRDEPSKPRCSNLLLLAAASTSDGRLVPALPHHSDWWPCLGNGGKGDGENFL